MAPTDSQPPAAAAAPEQAATTTEAPTSARRAGKQGYSPEETLHFLSIMEEILPIGGEEWEEVLSQHSMAWPGRNVDSLRRKYSTLYRKKMPTGDPNMPPEVRVAKRVKYKIGDKANIGDGEEEYDLLANNFSTSDDTPSALGQESTQDEEGTVPTQPTTDTSSSSRASAASSIPSTPSTCRRHSKRSSEEFLDMMRLQMEHDMKQHREEREECCELINTVLGGLAAFFGDTNKRSKRSYHSDSDSD